MRIGIDLGCWSNLRGYGRYTRNLLQALLALDRRHTYLGFADAATAHEGTFPSGLQVVPVAVAEPPAEAAAAEGRRRITDLWRMSRAVQRAQVDLIFFPSSYTYFPVLGRTRCVVVVHDAIAERLPDLIFPTRAGRLAWTVKTRLACWQARRVVTVSHAAAEAIQRHLPVSPDRLRVIYEAPDPIFGVRNSAADVAHQRALLEQHRIPLDARLVLYVGGFGPHKNVGTLVNAFAELTRTSSVPVHLVLVGKIVGEVFHSELHTLRQQVRHLGLESSVTFTGFVPDDDLVHLYQTAACVVLPSREEGFGLPIVEAMACGVPVIASRTGALPELVGDTAGLLINPDHPAELVGALYRLALATPQLRASFGAAGRGRAAELSWERAAADLLAVFEELDPTAAHRAAPRPRYRDQYV